MLSIIELCLLQSGLQAIHLAAQEGKEEMLRFLIEKHKISINVSNDVSYMSDLKSHHSLCKVLDLPHLVAS